MRVSRRYLPPAVAAGLLACAAPALAVQTSDGFVSRIAIQTSCTVVASDLDFGAVGTINGGETAAATVTVQCSLGTPYGLSFSPFAPVTSYAGQMVNGPQQVLYSAVLSAAGGIGPGSHTIMGLLAAQATPPAGIYTDNRTVYVNY